MIKLSSADKVHLIAFRTGTFSYSNGFCKKYFMDVERWRHNLLYIKTEKNPFVDKYRYVQLMSELGESKSVDKRMSIRA